MRYQIVCTTRKANDSIDKLGFIQEGGNKNQAQHVQDKEYVNDLIRKGNTFFFTNEEGKEIDVIAVEDTYVRTSPDETQKNNLLHLRACRVA